MFFHPGLTYANGQGVAMALRPFMLRRLQLIRQGDNRLTLSDVIDAGKSFLYFYSTSSCLSSGPIFEANGP